MMQKTKIFSRIVYYTLCLYARKTIKTFFSDLLLVNDLTIPIISKILLFVLAEKKPVNCRRGHDIVKYDIFYIKVILLKVIDQRLLDQLPVPVLDLGPEIDHGEEIRILESKLNSQASQGSRRRRS